ncbi:MAG: hypothetical protein H6756_10090 [Candidatus Omnitrophica bacterium]|nr:hypothetical protein [Candidatus Omnitrophota bacterium]
MATRPDRSADQATSPDHLTSNVGAGMRHGYQRRRTLLAAPVPESTAGHREIRSSVQDIVHNTGDTMTGNLKTVVDAQMVIGSQGDDDHLTAG